MDGRVYDPVVGRFLSADPMIQDPENLQSLNRYSYCVNNPLSLTDPSGYSWLSSNWRSLVGAVIGIAASVATAGLLAPAGLSALTLWGAAAAGAVGGFAGGVAGTLLNGGDLGQALKAGIVGGVIGGAAGFLSFAAGAVNGNSIANILERMGRHAFVNAWLGGIQGQNIWSAALVGATSSLGGAGLTAMNTTNVGLLCAANAVIGGTVSLIGGGKFANGAVTGAFTMLFNDCVHNLKEKTRVKNEWGKMYIISNVSEDADLTDGHAWIRLESKDGKTVTTMSLWGNRGKQEFWTDLEIDAGYGEVNKSATISVSMFNKISVYNSNPSNINWTPFNTCAGYSAGLWNYVTGNNLSARDNFFFTTPRALSKSILNSK